MRLFGNYNFDNLKDALQGYFGSSEDSDGVITIYLFTIKLTIDVEFKKVTLYTIKYVNGKETFTKIGSIVLT